jgi:hypothetical protein
MGEGTSEKKEYAWRDDDVRNRISEQAWYERHIQAAILRAE